MFVRIAGVLLIGITLIACTSINRLRAQIAVGGLTYYVCDNGDDKSVGTTKAKPLKTYEKAMSKFGSLHAGDSILFCRGGNFNVTKYSALFNTKFRAHKPGTIGDYFAPEAIGDEPRPIISSLNNGALYFNTQSPFGPDGGLIVQNLELRGRGIGMGIFLLNGFSDVKVKNVLIDGFEIGMYSGGGAQNSNNVSLTDSQIQNNTGQGWLGGGDNLLIEDNSFHNNGYGHNGSSISQHNVYVSNNELSPGKNIIVKGNDLYKSANVDGKCGGASLVVHGQMENLLIEKNTIREDEGAVDGYCYGLGVGPAYSSGESFKDVRILNNLLINVGRVGISGGSLVTALISGNTIIDYGSVLDEGILVPEEGNGNDAKSNNVEILNNTIIANNSHAIGVVIGGSFPYTVKYNTISFNADSENTQCFKKTDANVDTDTSTTRCIIHNKEDGREAQAQQAAEAAMNLEFNGETDSANAAPAAISTAEKTHKDVHKN